MNKELSHRVNTKMMPVGLSVDYKAKYTAQQQVIKDHYQFFDVPYNGTDNNNYADGEGFFASKATEVDDCCNDGTLEAAQTKAMRKAQSRAVAKSFKDPDNYENLQFFYHPDHLGSSSFITNLDGEVVQHIEYVPFGEVFIEERNSVWNTPYLFNAKEFDEETGLYYYGSRYYNSRLSIWLSSDPMHEKFPNVTSYNYCLNNPIKFLDDDGDSPISVLAKMIAKQGVKVAIKRFAKQQIEHRLKNYMSKNIAKQFAKDLDDILGTLDNTWWETGIELIPIAGDIYGGTKFGIKVAKAYEKLQDLENKYVKKIYEALPASQKAKFKKAMRNAGVRDARKDQNAGVEDLGISYQKGKNIDGHHEVSVKEDISRSSDPRNIEFMNKEDHQKLHSGTNTKNKSRSDN